MNKKDFYKNYYSDFKMSENEKRMILNDLHSELSSGTKPLYSKLKFKAAVSVALSVCIISSALTYSQYNDRHNVPVQTENTNSAVTEQSSSETEVINSDTITITIPTSTDVPQNSETYKTTESFSNDYTEISESRISDTEKSSEAETNVTNTDLTVSESHTSREPDNDAVTEPVTTDSSETIVPVTTSKRITDIEDTTNEKTDDVTNHPVTTTCDTVEETREYPMTTTVIVTTVGDVTTTAAAITTAPEETTTEETTTTTSETTVPAYETEAYASQPPEENY